MGPEKTKRSKTKARKPAPGLLDQIAGIFSPLENGESELAGKTVKYFLCGRWPDVRISKKGRPYFICDPCGMQVFVRGNKGIERLKEKVREAS